MFWMLFIACRVNINEFSEWLLSKLCWLNLNIMLVDGSLRKSTVTFVLRNECQISQLFREYFTRPKLFMEVKRLII